MNENLNTVGEMRELCHEFIENSLIETQLQRLDYLIKNDFEARVEYVELMNMHNTLSSYLTNTTPLSDETFDLEEIVRLDQESVFKTQEEDETPQGPLWFNLLQGIPGYFSHNTLQTRSRGR